MDEAFKTPSQVSVTGNMASAMMPASILMNRDRNSQMAMTAMAEVAAFLQITEKNRLSASQKQMYMPVNRRNTKILASSSPLGASPVVRRPAATTSTPMEYTIIKMMEAPARNFPLMMESR